ncbi:unnamed protein product [Leptidea sinapis]|uniref:Uncharacterized protein n=1 Tax=Leptidea sinapis TaxID=189913 RepID=A0A5E4R8I4_9NEOP|nr:unnamed protein product [Leptidea sinapis]
MSKSNGVDTDWARSPPPAGPLWMRICKAIYDPEEKSFLGRTPKRWDDNYGYPDSPCFFIKLNKHQQIWVSCWDPSSNDTRIEYPWGRGLPGRFYPYLNDDGYLSPFLAIKIKPQVNRLSSVRCRAWAKNIRYNKSLKEPSGFTLIQIFVEDNTALNNTETLAESK